MFDHPYAHLRGAVGDLMILFPILKSRLRNLYNTNACNLCVTGPLDTRAVYELLYLQNDIEVKTLMVNQSGRSGQWSEFAESTYRFEELFKKKFDILLNHVNESGEIQEAECIDEDVDFSDFSMIETPEPDGWLGETSYMVVAPVGRSNQFWSSTRFRNLIRRQILAFLKVYPGGVILLIGKHSPDDLRYKCVYPNSICSFRSCVSELKSSVIPLYNTTDLYEAFSLMQHAELVLTFDNGMKNLAYLTKTPTIACIDRRWEHANPVGAWSPPSLVYNPKLNNKVVFIDEENTELCSTL